MKTTPCLTAKKQQQGSTLIIVVVLLLLATLIVIFAVNLGALTQRSSGNDLRSRLVQQAADSALSQASETLLADSGILTDAASWELCDAADTSFPCGAIPAARRAGMYRYIGGTQDQQVFDDNTVDNRMLNLENKFTTVNNTTSDGFAINYGVGVVACRLTPEVVGVEPSCSTDPDDQIRVYAVTLVAVAAMPDEGARATAVRSFATNTSLGLGVDVPSIIASGTITLRGTMQIVTSPNAGGPGVAVSLWTPTGLDSGGTPDTCYADEFYRSDTPTWYPAGSSSQILACPDCNCSAKPLTRGSGGTCEGGMDILANPADCVPNANENVIPEEFPCDLFRHIFGIQAAKDTDGDHFCETKLTTTDPEDSTATIDVDQAYLSDKADWIIVPNYAGFNARFQGDARVITCNDLEVDSGTPTVVSHHGLVWDITGNCGSNKIIGSPEKPVLLVSDAVSPSNLFSNMDLFGLLFVRSSCHDGATCGSAGDAVVKTAGKTNIYGAMVVQGVLDKSTGSSAVIHNTEVLTNLVNDLSRPDVIALPGSWTDKVRY